MEAILRLLRSSSNEEKIAGVILSGKLFDLKSRTPLDGDNLSKIVSAVEPVFLIRMLRNVKIRDASMNVLQSLKGFPELLALFTPYAEDVYNILLQQPVEASVMPCPLAPAFAPVHFLANIVVTVYTACVIELIAGTHNVSWLCACLPVWCL